MKNNKRNIRIRRQGSKLILEKEPQSEKEKKEEASTSQQEKKQQARKKIKLERAKRSSLSCGVNEKVFEQLSTGDSIRISGPAAMNSMSMQRDDIKIRGQLRRDKRPLDRLSADDSPGQSAAANQGAALTIAK